MTSHLMRFGWMNPQTSGELEISEAQDTVQALQKPLLRSWEQAKYGWPWPSGEIAAIPSWIPICLVVSCGSNGVSTPLKKYIGQLGLQFSSYGKIKNIKPPTSGGSGATMCYWDWNMICRNMLFWSLLVPVASPCNAMCKMVGYNCKQYLNNNIYTCIKK